MTGWIPSEVGLMTSLEYLNLRKCFWSIGQTYRPSNVLHARLSVVLALSFAIAVSTPRSQRQVPIVCQDGSLWKFFKLLPWPTFFWVRQVSSVPTLCASRDGHSKVLSCLVVFTFCHYFILIVHQYREQFINWQYPDRRWYADEPFLFEYPCVSLFVWMMANIPQAFAQSFNWP